MCWKVTKNKLQYNRLIINNTHFNLKTYLGDTNFRWLHRQADLLIHDKTLNKLTKQNLLQIKQKTGNKAPIVLLGYQEFKSPNFKGELTQFRQAHPDTILHAIKARQFKLPEKIVLMGGMNENWGYLSNHILNRTW